MMLPPLPILVGLLAGLCLGGSVRYLAIERDSAPGDSSQKPQGKTITASAPSSGEQAMVPRPSFEEVLQVRGMNDAAVLSRYLEEATMEEVLALMEVVSSGDAKINDLGWMIEVRGLELDPASLIAWTKIEKRGSGIDRRGLYQKWAVIDPKAALLASLAEPIAIRQNVISAMQGGDLNEGIAILKEVLPNSPELKEFEKLRWAERARDNPRAALTEVLGLEEGSERTRNLEAVVDAWATKDPLAAVAWLEDQDDFDGATGMMETALGKLAETDPRLARTKIEALPQSISKAELEGIAIRELANLDRDEALNWAKELGPGVERDFLFASMAEAWEDEPEELLRLVLELEIEANATHGGWSFPNLPSVSDTYPTAWKSNLENHVNRAVIEVAKEYPKRALLALHSLNLVCPGQEHFLFLPLTTKTAQEVARMWVNEDPGDAASWAVGLGRSLPSSAILEAVFEPWASDAPEDAAAFVLANGLSADYALSLTIAKQWSTEDLEAAIEWTSQLDESVSQNVLASTLESLATTEPIEALLFLSEVHREGAQINIIRNAASAWREKDPEGLMIWLIDQPPQEGFEFIIRDSVQEWALNQPKIASEWVVQMQDGRQKDQAAAGIVSGLINLGNLSNDFTAAEEWAHAIADPLIRQQSLIAISSALNR